MSDGSPMYHDGVPVTAAEMVAKMAAELGVDPAVLNEECQRYAWHMNALIGCHQRFDVMKGPDYGAEFRRHAAHMIVTDGQAREPDR